VYYIQAQEVEWDYAPSGLNMCNGKPFNVTANSGDPSVWTEQGLGRKYKKALYRRYTDDSFQTQLEREPSESHLGHLGPLMKAAVGQTITIYLKNALSFPVNLKVVAFEDDAAPVQPGATQVYRFKVLPSAGPGPNEPATKLYLYRSTVDLAKHGDAGLVGPLLVSNTPPALTAARDLITVLQIINEGNSPFLEANLAGRTPAQLGLEDEAALEEANMKHTINGYLFCNGPNLTFQQAQPARWHMASLGSETDVHNAHFHGNTALYMGHRVDQVNLLPGSTHSLDFSTENSGKWLLHCHIGDHIAAGMKAIYSVERDPSLPPHAGVKPGQNGTVRNYFVAVDEVDWQYVPQGKDLCDTGGPRDLPPQLAHLATEKFRKALYREYTDATFTTRRMPSGDDYILGIMGPLLRAEVGDTIRVTFNNNLKEHAVTLHPHGVAYLKNSEGSPYQDGTGDADKGDDYVQPGATYVYEWHVPETSGPGPKDPDSIIYMYHSHVDEVADVYSGLQGAIVIGRKGQLRPDSLVAKQVDREMVFFFSVINEAATLFVKQNAGNDSGYPEPVYRHVINGELNSARKLPRAL
jgi:hephaestin